MPSPSPNLITKLTADWPSERWRDVTVLVAVSGGADSVALLRALIETRAAGEGRLAVAHFNHRLRGAASDADEAFVRRLGQASGLEVIVEHAQRDLAAQRDGEGLEGAARNARYEFLASAAGRCGARYVTTAHTADDQVETILHNILRGTGLGGLAGIPRARRLTDAATVVRPLLDVTRAEVLEYLTTIGQSFREDATNAELHFTRNRLRHELLPLLEQKFNPQVRQALLRLARIASEADELIQTQIGRIAAEVTRPIAGGFELHTTFLRHTTDSIGRQLFMWVWQQMDWPLQDMSFEKWEDLVSFAQGDPSSAKHTSRCQMFPGGVTAELDQGVLRLTRAT